MFNFFRNPFPRTVDSIMGPVNTAIAQLRELSGDRTEEIQDNKMAIESLQDRNIDLTAEVSRADSIRKKLEGLVSG